MWAQPGASTIAAGLMRAQDRRPGLEEGMTHGVMDAAPRISEEQLPEVLELMAASDSVELKLTVPESDHRSAIRALRLDPLDAQIRQVYFFDTPDLALDKAGLVVRGRRSQGKGDDSVVKLRPVVPGDMPKALRRLPNFRVEVDALPGGYVCSASFKGKPDLGSVKAVADGEAAIKKLFSKEQRSFFQTHSPGELDFTHLRPLGPIFVLKLGVVPEVLGRKIAAELWLFPDDSRILELSTRCAPNEAFQVAAEGRAFLTKLGISLTGEQATKTRRALELYASAAAADA
jgi:hypothetical protein